MFKITGAKFLIFIAIIAILFIFSGFIKFFFKRLKLKSKVKKLCKQKGYTLNVSGSWFANFDSEKADFTVGTPTKSYVVKLVGAKHRTHYDLVDDTHYRTTWMLFSKNGAKTPELHEKKKYDFGEIKEDTVIPILLLNPVAAEFTYKDAGTGNGDFVGEAFLYNLTGFLNLIESDETPKKRKKVYGE